MTHHLVLVGLPGAGKSSAGRRAAELLRRRFVDIDESIKARIGMSIERFFAEQGEAAFRLAEGEEVTAALGGPDAVIAPGAGWAAIPGAMESARARALTVYLKIDPASAAARIGPGPDRPLLQPGASGTVDVAARIQALLAARASHYERCDVVLNTDGCTVDQVAEKLTELARSRGA